jgi:hypothetical protein
VNLEFSIPSWAACGPGLATADQWRAWSADPAVPAGEPQPALAQVPPMVRRRLNTLGRTALQVAFDLHTPAPDVPVVFASRYGDASRSLALLAELVRREPLSPTAFGLSVHNAIGAMYSLIRGDHANYVSVAAGAGTAAAGLVEAVGLLADGAPEVLVVFCDAPLPDGYATFEDGPATMYAWAWRVTAPVPGQVHYTLAATPACGAPAPDHPQLPYGLDLMRFVAADAPRLQRVAGGTTWTWQRHHA